MELAIEGTSATDAARRLGLPRQMVNYHVQALQKAGFVIPIGEVRRRNMMERRVRATARSYLISPDILGALSGARRRPTDSATREALLALTARIQSDLGSPGIKSSSPAALSFSSKIHFSTEERRGAFIRALGEAVVNVVQEFARKPGPPAPDQQPFGFILGLYPLPQSSNRKSQGDQR